MPEFYDVRMLPPNERPQPKNPEAAPPARTGAIGKLISLRAAAQRAACRAETLRKNPDLAPFIYRVGRFTYSINEDAFERWLSGQSLAKQDAAQVFSMSFVQRTREHERGKKVSRPRRRKPAKDDAQQQEGATDGR